MELRGAGVRIQPREPTGHGRELPERGLHPLSMPASRCIPVTNGDYGLWRALALSRCVSFVWTLSGRPHRSPRKPISTVVAKPPKRLGRAYRGVRPPVFRGSGREILLHTLFRAACVGASSSGVVTDRSASWPPLVGSSSSLASA